ncbi:putative MFS family arabinose efflux permease [Streptohalobacillus salinus]|uniref:Putative MFS family arabinose efflux permease n=1 Tax=Streptohalobacillus salinus TaxID=621096 RepID=A0A2V3WFJ3_9BACI|nr:OFA family MFS transporter [Streptohalobacillus salinus]PXW93045.1 putative MFS family arabinose efflux permease [Streptohalobacillus salinus]
MQVFAKTSTKGAPPYKRWLFIFLGIIIMMFLGTVYSYSVFRVALEEEFQLGASESGLPYMFALTFYAVFMLIIGKYMRTFHPRTLILFGGMLVATSWVLASFSPNIYLLTISYGLVGGAGVGIAYGVMMNVIAQWFPDKKGLASGLVLLGFGLSPLVTAPVARLLVEQFGVMDTFLIMGISFAVILPFLSVSFKYPNADDVAPYLNKTVTDDLSENLTSNEMLKTKSFKGIYLNFIIGTLIGLMLVGMTLSVGVEYFHLDAATVTGLMALFAVFNGLGRPTFGWLTDHYSARFSMLLSYLLIMTAALSLILFHQYAIVYPIAFSIFWFNLGGWLAIAPTATLKHYGMWHYSQNYGLVFTAYGIGAIIGVLSSGMMIDVFGNYQYIFYYVIVLCVLGMGITRKYIK